MPGQFIKTVTAVIKNFVVVDCAALPENLIEGMLFGHEKGAFTNADQAREGLIYQANGGTLFLDEIGEMPLSLQKVFLRVLQEHRFRPLGSNRELESDFRLVAATNRNLDEMVKSERFRSDLLFRISTFVIELPSFRERPEDIKELARYHTDRICEHYGTPSKEFSPDFLKMLAAYSWPGNVRELVNTLERTIAAARFESILFPKHLPIHLRIEVTKTTMKREAPSQQPTEQSGSLSLPQLHELRDSIYSNAEKQYLHDLMALTDNNVAEACRVSGLSPIAFLCSAQETGHSTATLISFLHVSCIAGIFLQYRKTSFHPSCTHKQAITKRLTGYLPLLQYRLPLMHILHD